MTVILAVLLVALLMLLLERVRPGRRWPQVKGFYPRAVLLNAVQAGFVLIAGLAWDRWFDAAALWHLDASLALQVVWGYLLITFVYYWWHRMRHENVFLWRWLHQVHHSPARLEVVTSFYKHPLEIGLNSVLSSLLLYLVLSLSPLAATITSAITGLAELFYHWNVRTPHWLGYLFQRPESHCVHHARGWHRLNYSDLPLWDMLFGTFYNPRGEDFECGFDADRERHLLSMLLGRNVNRSEAIS
ncbi:MAG: sterol desaturase family protein [Gammaproteobacteria bacterium]|nr:sterol desaturase family protein [Gammaproteobacteria bacterium]